jgi:hypothetical protein
MSADAGNRKAERQADGASCQTPSSSSAKRWLRRRTQPSCTASLAIRLGGKRRIAQRLATAP